MPGLDFVGSRSTGDRRKHEVNEKTIKVEAEQVEPGRYQSQVLIDVGTSSVRCRRPGPRCGGAAKQEAAREKLREVTAQYGQKTKLLRDVLQQQASVEKC